MKTNERFASWKSDERQAVATWDAVDWYAFGRNGCSTCRGLLAQESGDTVRIGAINSRGEQTQGLVITAPRDGALAFANDLVRLLEPARDGAKLNQEVERLIDDLRDSALEHGDVDDIDTMAVMLGEMAVALQAAAANPEQACSIARLAVDPLVRTSRFRFGETASVQ